MSLPLTPITIVDGVNIMLQSIGESPVSSVTSSPIYEVNVALTTLGNVNRAVQGRGWYFNTDYGYPLAPGIDGTIAIPATALRVVNVEPDKDIVQRSGKLYDRRNQTFQFADPVKCNIVWVFDFEDIPQSARDYISLRAALTFSGNNLGSVEEIKFTEEDANQALAVLKREELEADAVNIFQSDPTMLSMVERRYNYPYNR